MRLRALLVLAIGLGLAACDSDSASAVDDTVEITVLVAYTSGAGASVPSIEAAVDQAFAETNAVYEASRIDLRLVPAHFVEVDHVVTDRLETLANLLRLDDGVLDEVHPLRDAHEADVVLLISNTPGSTINGVVMATPENAFLIVQLEFAGAPSYGLAHEMGHLQGARHSLAEDPDLEPFPYGHGFRNDSLRTIMANGPQQRVPYFSAPDQRVGEVVLGDSATADAARVLRESAVFISNFRGPQTPTDFVSPGTWPRIPDL